MCAFVIFVKESIIPTVRLRGAGLCSVGNQGCCAVGQELVQGSEGYSWQVLAKIDLPDAKRMFFRLNNNDEF